MRERPGATLWPGARDLAGGLCRLEREFVLMGKDFGSFLIVRVTIRNRDVLAGGLTRLETDLLLIGKDLSPFLILTDTIRNAVASDRPTR